MDNLSLYIHIPFCVKKCNYCDFLSAPCDAKTRQLYVERLCEEIAQRADCFTNKQVDTIFFGGGTPSILSANQMEKIMSVVRSKFHVAAEAEISIEVNPGTVDRKKLETYKKLGINRLSIGLQSADNDELKVLGRIHTWEEFIHTWELVREIGYCNVNIDLMSALPGQTLESYEETLKKVLALKPEHISAYSLIIEEGTKFYEWFGNAEEEESLVCEDAVDKSGKEEEKKSVCENSLSIRNRKLPDEITDRKMYEMTRDLLEEHGYYRYEISNYALEGYECKHNVGYWKRKEYLGLGLGAASLISNVRSSNINDLSVYLEKGQETENKEQNEIVFKIEENGESDKAVFDKRNTEVSKGIWDGKKWIEEQEELSIKEQMEEFMFLGLRMMEGVSTTEFEKQFGKPLQEVYGKQISKLIKQGLLEFCEDTKRYVLTLQGIDVSNQVFVEFIE